MIIPSELTDEEQEIEDVFDWALEDPIAVVTHRKDIDLSEFSELKKVAWEQRSKKIQKRFESVEAVDWDVALGRDINLFGRILRDILKLEQAVPGRPGPRPSLDQHAAIRRMMQLLGKDFTILPFHEAFQVLAAGRSVRHVARIVGLNKSQVARLLTGENEADGFQMRVVAEAFGKHPSYFLEWRILYITAALVRRMEWSPETTIRMFRQLDEQLKQKNHGGA